MSEKRINTASKLFKVNPKEQKVFFTSDDTPFFNEHNAKQHAKGLQKKTVDSLSRNVVEAWLKKEALDKNNDGKVQASEKIEALEKAETLEELDKLLDGDERKTVLTAYARQKSKLEEGSDSEAGQKQEES